MAGLHQFRDLIAIAAAGSLNGAARALGVSQPVLTKNLQALEREFGVRLVDRNARGAELTAYGRVLLDRARAIEHEVSGAREDIAQLLGAQAGRVVVGVAPAPLALVMPAALQMLRARFPDAVVRIVEGLYPSVLRAFRDETLDFAVGPLPRGGLDASFQSELLFQSEMAVVARSGHPLARARTIRDLVAADWIVAGPRDGPGAVINTMFTKHELGTPRCVAFCDSATAALDLLAGGDSLTIVPRRLVEDARARSGLRFVDIAERIDPAPISLFRRRGAILTPAAQALASAMRMCGRRLR